MVTEPMQVRLEKANGKNELYMRYLCTETHVRTIYVTSMAALVETDGPRLMSRRDEIASDMAKQGVPLQIARDVVDWFNE